MVYIDENKFDYSYANDTVKCKQCDTTSTIDNCNEIYCHKCGLINR
jgi:Zn finger protein HypA/HybF involved in hydrogenase expression